MRTLVIHASRVLTPHEAIADGVVLVEGAKITAVGHRDEIQIPPGAEDCVATGLTVAPGFVDIHIHGASGHDVMEATEKSLGAITAALARRGTTSIVATTVTASRDETLHSLKGIAKYIRSSHSAPSRAPKAEILGVHLEGPFINSARRGVHPADSIAKPSVELLEEFLAAADGFAQILTLAPEIHGALDLVSFAASAGLVVALGHTDATYEEARAAIDAGARHAVHVFNAMRPFSHRETGILGAILTDPEITAEVIADGVHVAGPAIQLLLAAKGAEHVLLASDATAATGMPDGKYRLGNFQVEVERGICRNSEGRLAGSTLTLDRAVRNIVSLGVQPLDAVRMATLQPARRLGLAGKKGLIAPGADADLVLLTSDLKVEGVLTRGVGLD